MKRIVLLSLAVATMSLASCDRVRSHIDDAASRFQRKSATDPVTVRVLPAGETQMTGTACYVGTVESSRSSSITCPCPGTVAEVYVREGQRVRAGERLARIESQTVTSAYEMARATLDQARDAMSRLEKVYGSGSVPEIKLVEMKTNLDKAAASEKAAAKALEDCVVKAPFQGVVDGLNVSAGEDSEFARILMRVVDPSSIEIHFPLPENEYMNVAPGDTTEVVIPALGKTFRARVNVKGAVASRLSHSYDCTLGGFTCPSGLMPGMVCKVYLSHGTGCGTVVPATSVMTDGNGRYVWVVRDGVVAKSYIEVGGYSGDGIVAMGLGDGDAVITEGVRKVSTGMSVKIVD